MSERIGILLVDDHAMVRAALRELLERESDFQMIGEASDASKAIQLATELRPDIILMDIDMPGLIVFDAAQRIGVLRPESRIIFVSAFYHDHLIEQALRVKARGYVIKNEPTENLAQAIRDVHAGNTWFSETVQQRLVVGKDGVRLAGQAKTWASTLTQRELEVLRYIARGLSKKEIAKTMGLSTKTVENHSSRLMRKLDIHDRVELARFAIREGLAEA